MFNKNSCIQRVPVVLIMGLLITSGCSSVVDFGDATPSALPPLNTLWKDDIQHTNTYFAYAIRFEHVDGKPLTCEKGAGTPFSNFKQSYSLVLRPNKESLSNIGKPQPVITFEKDKTTCKVGVFNRLLTPFRPIKDRVYKVGRMDIVDEEVIINYEQFYDLAKNITSLSAAGGVTGAAGMVPILDNDVTRAAYSGLAMNIDSAVEQWARTNKKSFQTIQHPILEVNDGVVTLSEIKIPISLVDGNKSSEIVGRMIIYPEFRRSIWVSPAEASGLNKVTLNDIKNKNISNFFRSGNWNSQTYGVFIDGKNNSDASSLKLSNIGKNINWSNPNFDSLVGEQKVLLEVCKKTKEYIADEGMHDVDQQMFLAHRMEMVPLWRNRNKSLPRLPKEDALYASGAIEILDEKSKLLALKNVIDLSDCFNDSIQESLGNPIVKSTDVDEYLNNWENLKKVISEKRLVKYFNETVWNSLKREAKPNNEEHDKKRYRRILSQILKASVNGQPVEFTDNRARVNESEIISKNSSIDALDKLWDVQLYKFGCFLQHEYTDVDGKVFESNSIEMLYVSHGNEIGTVVFKYSPSKQSSELRLGEVKIRSIENKSDEFLTRISNQNFDPNSNCMKAPFMTAMTRLPQE